MSRTGPRSGHRCPLLRDDVDRHESSSLLIEKPLKHLPRHIETVPGIGSAGSRRECFRISTLQVELVESDECFKALPGRAQFRQFHKTRQVMNSWCDIAGRPADVRLQCLFERKVDPKQTLAGLPGGEEGLCSLPFVESAFPPMSDLSLYIDHDYSSRPGGIVS